MVQPSYSIRLGRSARSCSRDRLRRDIDIDAGGLDRFSPRQRLEASEVLHLDIQLVAADLLPEDPRLRQILDTCKHTDRELLFVALGTGVDLHVLTNLLQKPPMKAKRRPPLIPSIIAAMKRAGNSGLVQAEGG